MDRRFLWLVAALALLVACVARMGEAPSAPVRVIVGETPIRAEVAATPRARSRGLSGRDTLPGGTGMLFRYDRAEPRVFWMRDMRFDLDVVWIRGDSVVDVTTAVRRPGPGGAPTRMGTHQAVDLVLEVPAGTVHAHGWSVGDPVRIEPLPPASAADSSDMHGEP